MFIYKSVILLISISMFTIVTGHCANSAPNTEIYKWTDEQGVIHFGDRPDDTSASVYEVPKNSSVNISTTDKERIERQKKLVDSLQADRLAKKKERIKKRKDAKTKKYNCQISKDKLARYQRANGLYVRNDVGEKIFLDEEKRKQEILLMKEQAEKWCK